MLKQSKHIILNYNSNTKLYHMNKKTNKEEPIIWSQTLNTYLGNKGYTLIKSELSINHQLKLKELLMVKPFVPGAPVQVQKTFPVYRESDKKIYIPRYFGEEFFGPPKNIKISDGDTINIEFKGTLRDYQEPIVNKFITYVNNQPTLGGLLELPCAWGKTSASLYICSKLCKKTLVIVHKEFLMNQWIERINQFLPDAKIGKIQGQVIDIDGKDIVLAMLQSLSMKDYPSNLFDSFGFTIIDEVHHISSETFSCALFKLVTKYMLGLSATMNRKDGTTKVFKMFLGEVVHKVERKNEQDVQIRAITYKTNDEEFNETILDYKGNPQISSMISKLCCYNRRTEFIIKVLKDFIEVENVEKDIIQNHKRDMDLNNPNCEICKTNDNYLVKNTCCNNVKYCLPCLKHVEENYDNPGSNTKCRTKIPKCPNCKKKLKYEQNYIENQYVKPLEQLQTLILSHNLNILHYIYNKIVCKNIASVGYYVGGMKEIELKKSETKQIILASFSMASEALDIPSLNAEFLITPKTDVVQSVGRVLRAKHKFSNPIIYDIKDNHLVFQKQWLKRKAYFKKQNYNIIECDSYNYSTNYCNWKNSNKQTFTTNELDDDELEDDDDLEDNELDDDTTNKDKLSKGVCFLKIKK